MIKILYESDFLGCERRACISCRFLHDLIHPCVHLALAHIQRKKEAISCTRLYVQDWRRIRKVSTSYPYDLISLHWFLRRYLCLFKTSCRGEMVTSPRRSVNDTSGLTSAGCHLTRLASDLGQACQKYVCTVHLWAAYDTFTLHPSLSPYSRTELGTEKQIHSLHMGWRNFFYSCAVVSVFGSGGE